MSDNKVKLEFKLSEDKTVEYKGVAIKITPFLSFAKQVHLINVYVEKYFDSPEDNLVAQSNYNYFGAEYTLMYNLLKLNTNVDTENLEQEFYVDPALWTAVTSEISNFKSFKDRLNFIMLEIKEQKALDNSVGKVLSGIAEKAYTLLENLSSISPEQIENIRKTSLELIEKVEKTSVFNDYPGATPAVLPKKTVGKKVKK